MGLFREEKKISIEYEIPFNLVWINLINTLNDLGKIEQKSKLSKYISFKMPMSFTRNPVNLDINLENKDDKTRITFRGSSFGGLLQINNSKSAISEIIENLERRLESAIS